MRTEQDARREPRPGDVVEVLGYVRHVHEPEYVGCVSYSVDGLCGLRIETIEHWCNVLSEHRAEVLHVAQEGGAE